MDSSGAQRWSRLGVFGEVAVDIIVKTSEPVRFGSDTQSSVRRRRGGSAATTAVVAAQSGRPTTLFTTLGDDGLSDWLAGETTGAGVDVDAFQVRGEPDSVVVIVGTDGERTMFPDRHCQPQRPALTDEDLAGIGWLHATAYGLADGDALADTLNAAVRAGIGVSVDVSSCQVIEQFGDELIELCQTVRPDIVLANGAEAALLGLGKNGIVPGAGATVVKQGPLGAAWRRSTGPTEFVAVSQALPIRVNTTGAGDAFSAGLLAAVDRGCQPQEALALGHEASLAWILAGTEDTARGRARLDA